MSEESAQPYLALKALMMPRDTNPYGTIFGGVLLSYIDQAGAAGVQHVMRSSGWPMQPTVTVGLSGVEFHEAVYVGDVVSFFTEIMRVGRTSITMHVTVEAERDGKTVNLTEAEITYVAVSIDGDERCPIAIRGE